MAQPLVCYFFFVLIMLATDKYLVEHSPGRDCQTRDLTVSFWEPALPSELEGAVRNLMALNLQTSGLAPEPLRNVCCASPWSVLAGVLV